MRRTAKALPTARRGGLTYAEADRVVSAIAGRLRRMGLPTDAVVGIQLPNIVENILTMLGVLRAGLIAAPLPLLWRRADAVTALARVGAKALITCGRVGNFDHGQLATRVAAEVFSIRYVCGFGEDLPDGVVPFDDLFTAAKLDPVPPLERDGNAAAHLAVDHLSISARTARCRSRGAISNCWPAAWASCWKAGLRRTRPSFRPSRRLRLPAFA